MFGNKTTLPCRSIFYFLLGCKLEDILIKEEPGSTREPGFSVESVSDELETREEHIRAESMDAPEHGLMMEQSPEV